MGDELLGVRDLKVSFRASGGRTIDIISNVSFSLRRGEKTALVGESGCGKSVLALALFGLLPSSAFVSGTVCFQNSIDLLALPDPKRNALRGDRLVLIPQNPASHLNPTLRIGYQMREGLFQKQGLKGRPAREKSCELLSRVGFEQPQKISRMYPHQLSGGMAQRVLLAIGLAGKADIVIADEPTRGLDIENQQRYLKLAESLYHDCAFLVITHQLEVAERCDWILVMYGGEIIESGAARKVLSHPQHPYTKGLLNSHPDRGMIPISGQPLSFSEIPRGCRFHPRCSQVDHRCVENHPSLLALQETAIRCHYANG